MKTTKYTITSRKVIALALVLVLLATMFVGCNGSKDENFSTTTTTTEVQTTIEVVTEIVTDKDGEAVTDDNGEALTTEVTKVVEVSSQSDKDNEESSSDKSSSTTSTTKGSSTTTTKQTETTTKKTTSTSNSNKVTTTTKPTSTSCSHSWSSYKWGKTEETYDKKYRTCSKCGKSESWELCNHSFGSWYNVNLWNDERECSKCGWLEEKETDNRDDYMGSKSEYLELLGYINEARREAGLNELVYVDDFQKGANTRAKELTESFSHTRPNGNKFYTAYTNDDVVYSLINENAHWGYNSTAKTAFDSWMNSEGHRKNILAENASHFVCARCDGYWVMSLAFVL